MRFAVRGSLRTVLTWTVGAGIAVASAGSAGFALRTLYVTKMRDTLALSYLELERITATLQHAATAEYRARPDQADVELTIKSGGVLEARRGSLAGVATLADLRLDKGVDGAELTVVSVGGEDYLVEQAAGGAPELKLWATNAARWLAGAVAATNGGKIYVLTRQGAVLYASDPAITASTYLARPLVQRFIEAPLRLGEAQFDDKRGRAWFGFFQEVPSTNLVAFAEVPRSNLTAPVRAAAWRLGLICAAGLAATLLAMRLLILQLTRPLETLVAWAREVSVGVFAMRTPATPFLEASALTGAFGHMVQGLLARDERIKILLAEQAQKIRVESELAIARVVQLNLLPAEGLPLSTGLELGISYLPAAELAGDWYGYCHSEATGEVTIVVADISGHGAGAAMFMTLVAGAFDELRRDHHDVPPLPLFADKVHRSLRALGRGSWHATMQAVRYRKGAGAIDILNAGHTFPLLLTGGAEPRVPAIVRMPSALLGDDELQFVERTVPFPPGSMIVLYSDGLLEAAPEGRHAFGTKRIIKTIAASARFESQDVADRLVEAAIAHLGNDKFKDDVSILVARAL